MKLVGDQHPFSLIGMANLALTHRNQGQSKEAKELEVQVMETRKRALGEMHLETLSSVANLALTYKKQRRWKEAEKLEVQEIETRKCVLSRLYSRAY